MGFGIRDTLFKGQASRHLPLPDFDLTDPRHVTLRLPGRFIDENYSRALLAQGDFTLEEIFALDRVQKGLPVEGAALRALRKRGLVEGRRPALHISAKVAAASGVPGAKGNYIRTRRQDDAHYKHLILDYLRQFGEASRDDLRDMLLPTLPGALSPEQKEHKIKNLMAALRRSGQIARQGGLSNARWRLG